MAEFREESVATLDDLIERIQTQTDRDEKDRAKSMRDRKHEHDSLMEWYKEQESEQGVEDKKNLKLQGIESHLTKNNQLYNQGTLKSVRDKGGLIDKVVNQTHVFKTLFGGFIERMVVLTKKSWGTSKDRLRAAAQRHGQFSNLWGAIKTDFSMILGMFGAIGNIPGFQTFWNVSKFLLMKILLTLGSFVKFMYRATGIKWIFGKLGGLIWKAIKFLAYPLTSGFGAIKEEVNKLSEAVYGKEEKEEKEGKRAPAGSKSDPFYMIPTTEGQKRAARRDEEEKEKEKDGKKGKDKDKKKEKPKKIKITKEQKEAARKKIKGEKKGFRFPFMDATKKFFGDFWKAISGSIKDIGQAFMLIYSKLLLPVLGGLKTAAIWLVKGLWKLVALIYRALAPMISRLIAVLWAFIVNMTVMMVQMVVQIITNLILLTAKAALMGALMLIAIAAMIIDIAMFIALNFKLVLIALAIGVLIWFLWGAWKYFEAKFMEWGDRMRLLGDKLRLMWDIVSSGDAIRLIGLGIKGMFYGIVEALENTFNVVIRWWNRRRIVKRFPKLQIGEVDWGGASTMATIRTQRGNIMKKYSTEARKLLDLEKRINESSKDLTFKNVLMGNYKGYGESVIPRQTVVQNIAGPRGTVVGLRTYGGGAAVYNNNTATK